MWEPFTESARHAVVRAQQVAQMFGSSHIGVEHIAFALAEGDDGVGRLFATGIDRDAIRERLGAAGSMPNPNMVFTSGAKHAIEIAFENARRLNHNYVSQVHLALGVLGSADCPPLAPGTDREALRTALSDLASSEDTGDARWTRIEGDAYPGIGSVVTVLGYDPEFSTPGTRVTISLQRPGEPERRWTYRRDDEPK